MTLYNVFTETNGYRVAKWSSPFDLEASYLVTTVNCDCPSRTKPCKHVSIVAQARAQGKVDTQEFFNPDTATWHLLIPKELERILSYSPKATWRRL